MPVVRVGPLPAAALEAAAEFHARVLPDIVPVGEDLVLVFPSAPYDHRGWRLAVVQDLARAAAPLRVNGIAGDDEAAISRAADWLAQALGITGQLLVLEAD